MQTNCELNVGNKTIYNEMDIHSYDTSNVVCKCVLVWLSQQKVSSEETHKGAWTCLLNDFISFSDTQRRREPNVGPGPAQI